MAKLDLTSKGFDAMSMSGFLPNYQSGSLGSIFSGIFGNPSKPYEDASSELSKYLPQAQSYQMPYMQAGQRAIPGFEQWLSGMKDPSGFINQQMGNYHESPFAHYQQEQGMRAAQNVGSASGLAGSTPLMQAAQQNAQNISSGDMNQWLQHVLGVNSQYGSGLNSLMNTGANSANSLTQLMQNYMGAQAGLAYGGSRANEQNRNGLFGGIAGLFGL